MSQQRQLAAIMFTDIEGYTAIMQQDEQRALGIKNRHREILEKEHAQYNGRVIHYFGDGTLSIFQSVVQAVQCALAMQSAFRQPPQVPLRIGLHIGDVILEDENVFGDGVNLASRIESLGVAGAVLMSDKVKDEISNHPELKTVSVGSYQFKNIERKVEVFALDHEELIKPKPYSLKGKTEEKAPPDHLVEKNTSKSIAVLPFVNMSNDPEQEYFSDGMAEEIINSLAHLKDIKVSGRMSSFQFKGAKADLREIGKKLGVASVLEGSVRKQGNRIRVTAQLVNVEDGFHFWSEKFDRNMDDIFAIQDEIALAITEQLKITLLEQDREKITRTFTHSTEAYEYYLKGRFHINRRGNSIMPGLHYFKQAIESDPGYALAYAGYADANMLALTYGLCSGKAVLGEAAQALETAIRLDDSVSEVYCSFGFYYLFERKWVEARKNFIKSIELKPSYAQAYAWYGMLCLGFIEGNFKEAERQCKLAIRLEPLSAIDHADLAWMLHTAQRFEDALAAAKTGIELDANSFLSNRIAALCCFALKRYDEAADILKYLIRISNGHQHAVATLIWVYAGSGNTAEARIMMNELKERSYKEYIGGALLGLTAAYMGDLDAAVEHLEKAFDEYDFQLWTFKYSPVVPAQLRNDPRFQNLLDKIGFPD